jgi:hypothetical protein
VSLWGKGGQIGGRRGVEGGNDGRQGELGRWLPAEGERKRRKEGKDPFKERFKKTRICESMPRHEAKMHFLLSSRWLPSSSMEVAPQNIAERKLAKNRHITASYKT